MNHYESDAVTRVKDQQAIERILSLDPRGLFDVVTQQDISMCGLWTGGGDADGGSGTWARLGRTA